MTDETWRRRDDERREPEDWERRPLFADDEDDDADAAPALSFGDGDTGDLPHWTEPPTGEVPRIDPVEAEVDEDVDVWSSFNTESAVWSEDVEESTGEVSLTSAGTRELPVVGADAERSDARPARITIGTDPSGMPRRPLPSAGRSGPRGGEAANPRDLPVAIAVGALLAAVFVATVLWRPVAVLIFVTLLLGLAAVEFYDKVGEKGYRPAVIPGILACVAAPLSAYWLGAPALPLVFAFALIAVAGGFIGARGIEAGPLPNTSITMLGIIWIGLMGSFAALILQLSTTFPGSPPFGTDTLFLLALGVVANDIGAYFIGSAAGRTPLRAWISPGKSVEGFIGGALFTIVVLVVIGITERSDTWTSTADLLLLGIVISIFAPMGDLVESMFKRNLDIKDFGNLVRGHGGVLDRFDGFLFTLPVVYYLTLVLEPWA